MQLLQEQGAIVKIVIMPTTGEQSPFQGFDTGILNPKVAEIILLASKAPKEIKDIFNKNFVTTESTLSSQNPIILISKENINNIHNLYNLPFSLLFCIAEDFLYAKKIAKKFTIPPIICSDTPLADIPFSKIDSIYSFDKMLYSRLKLIENGIRQKNKERKFTHNLKRRSASFKTSTWASTLNNTTLPNELLIESLGFMLSQPKKIKDGSSKREFINIMIESIDAYEQCLILLDRPLSNEIILYAPGMYSFLNDQNNELYKSLNEQLNSEEKQFLINGVLRNPSYSGFIIHRDNDSDEKPDFKNRHSITLLTSIRRAEMRLTTAAISLLSLHKEAPALRLPNAVNHYGNYLKKLEALAISTGITSAPFIKTAKAFNKIMRKVIGNKLRSYINQNYTDISFVCDIPLDWVRFNEVPIMFSHEISRMNTTPGNILLQQASSFPRTLIKASQLKKVLIIRSFQPDDHLKFILEKAIDHFKTYMPELFYEIIDVRTKKEFIDTLNKFDGFLLIMDCHGDHGGDKSHGWLIIGGEKVDTWTLKDIARVPPIVILSACLTSALSGSHASVANGFIISGALSVIGTLLPVNAVDSAVFVGRLIYRFYQFPAAIPTQFSHINLRLLLSIFLRMSYATDLIRGLEKAELIIKDSWQEEAVEINTYINMLNHDWFSYTISILTKISGLDEKELINFINNNLFITETMCYSQIGFPESITIKLRE